MYLLKFFKFIELLRTYKFISSFSEGNTYVLVEA